MTELKSSFLTFSLLSSNVILNTVVKINRQTTSTIIRENITDTFDNKCANSNLKIQGFSLMDVDPVVTWLMLLKDLWLETIKKMPLFEDWGSFSLKSELQFHICLFLDLFLHNLSWWLLYVRYCVCRVVLLVVSRYCHRPRAQLDPHRSIRAVRRARQISLSKHGSSNDSMGCSMHWWLPKLLYINILFRYFAAGFIHIIL